MNWKISKSCDYVCIHLPGLDIEDRSVRHGVEEGPEGGVAAAVVELVEQLLVGDQDWHRLVRPQT